MRYSPPGWRAPAATARWRPPRGRAGGSTSSTRGTLENLTLVESDEGQRPLGHGEIRVAVRAAGLNFRDVLIALDMYPGAALMGGEGAGVVVEVGADVEDLAPGDRVMGLLNGGFGPLAVADRRLVAPVPEGWSFEQAATVPVVFLTALLRAASTWRVCDGASGCWCTPRPAAWGWRRCSWRATSARRCTGPPAKASGRRSRRWASRRSGSPPRARPSSASVSWRPPAARAWTSCSTRLAGELVDASLDLLPRGGRFVEMGKTDVRDAEEVAAAHPGVAYRAFDMLEAGPERRGAAG